MRAKLITLNLKTKCFIIVSDGDFTCKIPHFWGWNFKSVFLLFVFEVRSKLRFVGGGEFKSIVSVFSSSVL